MLGLLDNVARRLVRRGFRQGLLEGSTAWLVIGAIAWLVRLLLRPEPPRVLKEELRLGESLTVTHLPPKSRRTQSVDPPAE